MRYRWKTSFDCPRTVAHRQRASATGCELSQTGVTRERNGRDRRHTGRESGSPASKGRVTDLGWLAPVGEPGEMVGDAVVTISRGRERLRTAPTRHGSTRPDRWGSVRLVCGCRPAAGGVVPARGGALRPPEPRRRLGEVAVRESSASARLWRRSHRLETQPSEEPVSPIGDRLSDRSGRRRRTDVHRGAQVRLHKSMTAC